MRASQFACPHGFMGGVGCGADVCQEIKRCAMESATADLRLQRDRALPVINAVGEWVENDGTLSAIIDAFNLYSEKVPPPPLPARG